MEGRRGNWSPYLSGRGSAPCFLELDYCNFTVNTDHYSDMSV